MKQTWLIGRIVCALVVIFAMGIWVGRMTGPSQKGETTPPPEASDVPDREWGSPEQRARTVDMVTKRVIPHYRNELTLSDEQLEELRPFFMHAGRQMAKHPPNTELRMWAVLQFHKRIKPLLDEQQQVRLEKIGEDVRQRHEALKK